MNEKVRPLTPEIYDYLLTHSVSETAPQQALREKTLAEVEHASMMTTPEQMQFIALLIKLMSVKRIIEVGVFTGYGSLSMAQALPDDGELIACDHSKDWPPIGQPFWEEAGIAHKIQLHTAPALETLRELVDDGQEGSFDFMFIDADKIHYADYYQLALELVRPGGLIIFDNVLWVGAVAVKDRSNPATKAVYQLTQDLQEDARVVTSLIPVSQGMLLALKR